VSPLSRFTVIGTGNLEEAHDAVCRVYLQHELTAENNRIDMRMSATSDCRMTIGYLTYRAPTELMMPPTETCYHINFTIAGQTEADRSDGDRERTAVNTRGLVLNPQQRNTVRWCADAEQFILKIPRTALESHLGELIGSSVAEVIDFDFGLDLTTSVGQSLLRSISFFTSELDRPGGLAEMPLAREQMEAFVMTQLLHAGRHQFSDALAAPAETFLHGRLAPVVKYMEAHADEPLTPGELARAGYMSVRTLHASFQQTFGESCMSYLRRIRLDHVRAELLRSDPNVMRVTDISAKWGFLHQSRFAQQYRERFGELPSATLRT
jgi:AraC-like DNA-binding protein